MLSIGQFAQSTGLTVKALRHYDERGLLVPATVDPETRHRAYRGSQIRDAVLIKAMRAADLPVESVRGALGDPAATREVLTAFRAEIDAARRAQDEALEAVERLVTSLENPSPVTGRDVPSQHYAAVVLRMPADGSADETTSEAANEAFVALHTALTRLGSPPSGPSWTGFDAVEGDPGTAEVTLCWPTEHPVDGELVVDGAHTRVGTLPPRHELVARRLHVEDGDLPPGVPHPAMIALLGELVRRDELGGGDAVEDMTAMRLIPVVDDGEPVGVEFAITLGR